MPFGAPPHGQSPLAIFSFAFCARSPSEGELALWGPTLGAFLPQSIKLEGAPRHLPGERVVKIKLLS